MRKYHSCGIETETCLDDFARMHRGAINSAQEQFAPGDNAVPGVQKQATKNLALVGLHAFHQVVCNLGVGFHGNALIESGQAISAAQFKRRAEAGERCRTAPW